MEPSEAKKDMDIDEIELALRRFASKEENEGLSKLLDSLFIAPVGENEGEEDGDE